MYWLHIWWTGCIVMKFLNFQWESDTTQNCLSKLWLVRFGPVSVKSKLSGHCQSDKSKWSSHATNCPQVWFMLMIETELSALFPGTPAPHWLRHFLLAETVFTVNICSHCLLLALSWQNVWKADLSLSLSLSHSFIHSLLVMKQAWQRHSNWNPWWANRAWGQSVFGTSRD